MHVDEPPGQVQVLLLAGRAVQVDQPHDAGVPDEMRIGLREFGVQAIGRPLGNFQQRGLPRRAMMQAGGDHQVAHVVRLVIAHFLKTFRLSQRHVRAEIAIVLLGVADHLDDLIHQMVKVFVLCDPIDRWPRPQATCRNRRHPISIPAPGDIDLVSFPPRSGSCPTQKTPRRGQCQSNASGPESTST